MMGLVWLFRAKHLSFNNGGITVGILDDHEYFESGIP
jgi:hypothetical protein